MKSTLQLTANQLGKDAFHAGKACTPCWDVAVCNLIGENNGKASIILKAWLAGWTEANLKGTK